MPDWTVRIVPASTGGGKFSPSALQAQQDDLVCWNNTTNETHQPWPTDDEYNPLDVSRTSDQYLSDEIPAGRSSRPSYNLGQPSGSPANWTVYYYCATHPERTNERGVILAQETPVTPEATDS
jgi:plastocyanin